MIKVRVLSRVSSGDADNYDLWFTHGFKIEHYGKGKDQYFVINGHVPNGEYVDMRFASEYWVFDIKDVRFTENDDWPLTKGKL